MGSDSKAHVAPSAPSAGPTSHGLLVGRTVIVTAAAGTGIGFATAQRCAEEGARVVISDRHERRLAESSEKLSAMTGEPCLAIACDVTDGRQVEDLFQGVVDAYGSFDVVVNNAGLGGTANVVDMTDDQWNSVLGVSLTGTFLCMRAALRHLVAQGHGAVVNNASVLGWRAQAGQAHYAAAKAGVMALTRCAALEVAHSGVRVNAVAPSIAMHENLSKAADEQLLAHLASQEAFGRTAAPWEVANVIVFLASEYSSYMTGEVISVSSQHP
jgi:3-oxoacyl-[acyl-carrier protein] reductase